MAKLSVREEANAITAYAFRNGNLETLHSGGKCPFVQGGCPISNSEIRVLMIQASERMAQLVQLKRDDPDRYWSFIAEYGNAYCRSWVKTPPPPMPKKKTHAEWETELRRRTKRRQPCSLDKNPTGP